MGYKIVDLNEGPKMTEGLERAVTRAFEMDDSRTTIEVPKREHLESHRAPGISCNHRWVAIDLAAPSAKQDNWADFLRQLFDETDLGDRQAMCSHCKAFALFDKDGEVWAYDASATLPQEQPRKEKSGGRDNRRQWRK